MVSGVQAPEKTDLMRKEMVSKMGELPDNITVNEPIPGKGSLENSVFGKQAYAQGDHSERDEPAYECIQYISKE
jgi:hypothetical protein